MIGFPYGAGQAGRIIPRSPLINGFVRTDLLFSLDTSRAESYPGSGTTFSNIITAPADGSAQTSYDYRRGVSGSDGTDFPDFVGAPGLDPCYFTFDGTDRISSNVAVGSVPTVLRQLHFANKKWTVEVWAYYNGTTSNVAPLFDTGTSDQGGADISRGVVFGDTGTLQQTAGRFRVRVLRDTGGASALAVQSDASLTAGNIYMLAASIDGSGAESSFLYRNGAYDPVASSNTFTGTYSSPGSTSTANNSKICARGDGAFRVTSGTRVYLVRVYQRNLSKSELDQNWANDKYRFGL